MRDEESWLEALTDSDNLTQSGAWYTLHFEDGTSQKFQSKNWLEKLKSSEQFQKRVLELMHEEIVLKYERKTEQVTST